MTITDRFLTALKTWLDEKDVLAELPEVRLRDWDDEFPDMVVVLDIEDEPVEDEDVRGQYEISASVNLRCGAGVSSLARHAAMETLWEMLNNPAEGAPEEFDFVRWMRTAEDRGIGDEELGVFEMLVGGGQWEITDEEVTGVVEVTVLAIGADLTGANFGL